MKQQRTKSTTYGFARASGLMQPRIRKASEDRGFAVSRLLTHWAEVVGDATAQIATPVNVSYTKGGMGATLTVLTTGAHAPMLEMQKDQIRDKVNACYGYRAISRVRITQTAPTGFADGKVQFKARPKPNVQLSPDAEAAASKMSGDVTNPELRLALAQLGAKVLSKKKTSIKG
ncbi:MAG: DciA family protein [Pseudomonadota bacterium]